MVNFHADLLTIEVDERTPGVLQLNWLGRSTARSPGGVLHPWFEQLFSTARERSCTIDMRFDRLELFNSSTIAVLIQLINSAQDRGIKLTVRYDARLKWQALSFDALRRALRPFEVPGAGAVAVNIVSI
ncbi:MAG: hypothetical protein Q8N26_00385 [Myxococcales bacterium]|nr:hypothetical protein [Myxococcales bacterium]